MNKDKWISLSVTALLLIIVILWISLSGGTEDYSSKYSGVDLSETVSGIGRESTYAPYLARYAEAAYPGGEVDVDIFHYGAGEGVEVRSGAAGESPALYTSEGSSVTWVVEVPESGFYNIRLKYLTLESRGVDIERSIYINGKVPFLGAGNLLFSRLWTDEGEIRKDNRGNEIRRKQTEVFMWQEAYCKDPLGYVPEPYRFYFDEGENTLTLEAVSEPMLLGSLALTPVSDTPSYKIYAGALPAVRMSAEAESLLLTIQGEDAVLRSSPSLYARYDRSSPATEPSSITRTVLNYIGGDPWRTAGQWIEWEFSVPEDGFYNITLKGRQRYQRGSVSCRTLYIDGRVPFAEMKDIAFSYANEWEMKALGGEEGAYLFYLTAGKHTLRAEATLGGMGAILTELEESIYRLNQIYRRILVLTGVKPDAFRDYNLHLIYPESIEAMRLESLRLYRIVDEAVRFTGQKSDRIAAAQTLASQLERFVEDPYRVTKSFTNFKDNITSLGTAVQNLAEIKLDIDSITISGAKARPASGEENFLTGLWHEVSSSAVSYFVDYDALGDVYAGDGEALEVWILTGRDQSAVLKAMVDDTFTPATGIKVNIKLVDPNALLGAVVAGNGPDIVLSTDSWNPVNYALRGSAEDLTQFEDFPEVISRFRPSAYSALELGSGMYGLPETQVVSVLFYREDILTEYGLEVPETWEELIGLLPTIQGNNMSAGIPYPTITSPNLFTLYSLIYQNGGAIYDEDARKTLVNEEPAIRAFEFYTSLFTDYGLPKEFDFVSRFRSGEMPIGVSEYTTYNTLAVSAPEIRGLWDFVPIPGTYTSSADGSSRLDRSAHSQGASCMMIATGDGQVRRQGWEFMKWWVSTEAQVRFGREIEAVLGSSARYATANIEALRRLAWSSAQLDVLEAALDEAVGFREVAGGYYTGRNITNAVRKVINKLVDPRETILDYARMIDREIDKKRMEFGLPVD